MPTTPLTASEFANATFDNNVSAYGAFSGVNIIAHINHVCIGSIMGISYTIHSEKQAQYTFGDPNPRSFVTGKRGIAGTLVFNQFDRDPLISVFTGANGSGQPIVNYAPAGSLSPIGTAFAPYALAGSNDPTLSGAFNPLGTHLGNPGNPFAINPSAGLLSDLTDADNNAFKTPLEYADQLPPFDVTLTMMNAEGKGAFMVITGIEIINQGGGFTIDDMRNEVAYTYVARGLRPLTPILSNGQPTQPTAMTAAAGASG